MTEAAALPGAERFPRLLSRVHSGAGMLAFRQGEFDERHGERALQHRFVGEDQHAFDLPLDLRLEVQGQVGTHPIGRRRVCRKCKEGGCRRKVDGLDTGRHDFDELSVDWRTSTSEAAGAEVHDTSVCRVKYFVMQSGEGGAD